MFSFVNLALAILFTVGSVGTDKILFRPVPMPMYGAQVLPLEVVSVPRYGVQVLPLEVVSVPGHGAQIFARAPTKSSVQTSARAREMGMGT